MVAVSKIVLVLMILPALAGTGQTFCRVFQLGTSMFSLAETETEEEGCRNECSSSLQMGGAFTGMLLQAPG